jgi:hypothetical protein
MRLHEFTSLNDYNIPDMEISDPSQQNTKILTGSATDHAARNLTEAVDIKKPKLADTL